MKKIIFIILLFSTCIFSQGRIIRSDEFNALRDSIQTWAETLASLGFVTPELYGADGTGLTDASTELNLALADAGANGYTLLALGTYKIDGHISVPANTKIDGKGVGRVKGKSSLVEYLDSTETKTGLWLEGSNITIENLNVDSTHIIFRPIATSNITIRNCVFENLNSTSLYGAILASWQNFSGYNMYLENIIVEDCLFTNLLGSGVMLTPDSCKNIIVRNNRFENIHIVDGSTIDLIYAGHRIEDSSIVVIGNTFDNISTITNNQANGRMKCITTMGTPQIVSENTFSNLYSEYGLGMMCIRASTRNGIVSNNIFQNVRYNQNGGSSGSDAGLIMMKSDGWSADTSNSMISGNRARDIELITAITLTGTGSIIGNEFELTGYYGIDLRGYNNIPDSADIEASKTVVSGNVLRQIGGYVFRTRAGHYDIINNDIKASDSAIVIATYDTAPDSIDLRFINNTIELDSAMMAGILVDKGNLEFKGNDIRLRNMHKTNYIMFDFSLNSLLTECRFINNIFTIDGTANILSLFRPDSTNLYLWDNTFINNGQVLALIYYTPKYVELSGNTFDSRLATASHSIIYVAALPADTILFNNNKMMSGGNISSIITGGYSLTDTLEYVEMIGNNIDGNSIVALDTLQNIGVLRLLGNVLKTTNILSGLGTIKNLYQDNNSEIGLANGQKLSLADQISSTNDNSITDSTITVTHNLFYTPTVGQIEVKPITRLGSASYFYLPVDSITSTTFKICLNTDAGQVVTFSWKVQDPTLEKLFSSEMCGDPDFTLGTWWTGTAYSSYVLDAMHIDCILPYERVFSRDAIVTVGRTYRITYQIKNYVSGTIVPVFGQYSGGTIRSANGTYTDDVYVLPSAPLDEDIFSFATHAGGAELDIDNVSIKEVLNP